VDKSPLRGDKRRKMNAGEEVVSFKRGSETSGKSGNGWEGRKRRDLNRKGLVERWKLFEDRSTRREASCRSKK